MTRINSIAKWISLSGLALAAGCQNSPAPKPAESVSNRDDVMDIRPMQATPAAPSYQPAPYQPVAQQSAYEPAISSTPSAGAANASAGNMHVVKHGETLYSIARVSYGDGKQWTRIASANPGVSPSSLKVGQSLVMP